MRETSVQELRAALYGLTRLVAGFNGWKVVADLPEDQRAQALLKLTIADLAKAAGDSVNADPTEVSALNRRLRAYQQICLLEKFCFEEVEW
jgi:hypothetical protein